MCGFIVSTGSLPSTFHRNFVLDSIKNRGPDMRREFYLEEDKIWFGFQRLSINDLSDNGMQPMHYKNRYTTVFNGEIYNFKKIKKTLINLGHSFISQTDTEVLLASYDEWGEEMLKKIEGMFAFVIWDDLKKNFFIAKDSIGQKPIFYYFKNNKLIIASNLNAIKKILNYAVDLNKNALSYYLSMGYIPSDTCIWNDINTLDAGNTLSISYKKQKFLKISKNQYWQLKDFKKNDDNLNDSFEDVFSTICNEHTNSDVPIGLALSGGLDSNTILNQIKEVKDLKAFSIGYNDKNIDETNYANKITKKLSVNLKTKILENNSELQEAEEFVCKASYQPQGYSSLIPFFLLSKFASKFNKVLLTGDGGDEIFLGYDWYKKDTNIKKFKNFLKHVLLNNSIEVKFNEIKKRSIFHNHIINLFPRFLPSEIDNILNLKYKFDYSNIIQMYKKQFSDEMPLHTNLQMIDLNNFTKDHICSKTDNMSMYNSLEVRAPFLDRRMISWALNQSSKNIESIKNKKILKNYLQKNNLLNYLNKKKQGFSLKIKNTNLIDKIKFISNSKLIKEGYLNKQIIDLLHEDKNLYSEARIKTCWNLAKWYEYQ